MKRTCAIALAAAVVFAAAGLQAEDGERFVVKDKNRRDPFTFSLRSNIPTDPEPPKTQPDTIRNARSANMLFSEAEDAALERHVNLCLEKCDAALSLLKQVPANETEMLATRQKLELLRKAADSMRQREEASAAFHKLNVAVAGVIARPRKAQAIINGVLVREGAVLNTPQNELLVVESISSEQVVLSFRGYRMAASLASAE